MDSEKTPQGTGDDGEKTLTHRQDLFCQAYAETGHATQAAIKAGYSRKSARSYASQLMARPAVKQRISEILASVAALQEVTREQIFAELVIIAFQNVADYISFTDEEKPQPYIDLAKMTRNQMAAIATVNLKETPYGTEIAIRGHDKLGALSQLYQWKKEEEAVASDEKFEVKHVFEFPHNYRDEPLGSERN